MIEIYLEEYTTGSIWCNSLVKLQTVKSLNPFITNLTGITNNDLNSNGVDIKVINHQI